jgi:nitrite reductase (NADH) small subunit
MAFLPAARMSEVPPGTIREVQVNGRKIAIANVNGRFYALDNTCLHRGGPLGQGELEENVVTCPWHGWQYDVTTGKTLMNPEAGVQTFPIELRGEEVFVDCG